MYIERFCLLMNKQLFYPYEESKTGSSGYLEWRYANSDQAG